MNEPNIELQTVELTFQDFDRAAILLELAFYDNPSHQYIFADLSARAKLLRWGLKANLKLNLVSPQSRSQSFALIKTDKSS